MRTFTLILLAALAVAAPPAGALTVLPATFEELVRESVAVLHGRVREVDGRWTADRRTIESTITLDVYDAFKGADLDTATFVVPGGEAGGRILVMPGAPTFRVGDEVVVFLRGRAPSMPQPVGLGLAFQLSNIARDVGDDLAAGRIYLPARWLREAGVLLIEGTPLDPASAAAVAPVVARLLTDAERYYDSAWHGVAHLPGRSAWAVATARLVYRDIGRAVAYRGAEAWTSRTTVGTAQKLARLVQAGLATGWMKTLGDRTAPPRTGLFTPSTVGMVG